MNVTHFDWVWTMLSGVATRAASSQISESGGPPDEVPREPEWHGWFEYQAFGVFLISHALTHGRHDRATRDDLINHCADKLEEACANLKVEGSDIWGIIGARANRYGEVAREASKSGSPNDEAMAWIRELRNFLLAGSPGSALQKDPPRVVGDFFKMSALDVHLASCFTNLYVPMLYSPLARICESTDTLRSLTPTEFNRMWGEGVKEAMRNSKRSE